MKRFLTFTVALIIAVMSGLSVSAEGKVTYSGDSGKFVFEPGSEYSPTDLFTDFKDVMPGDSISQKITLKNEASNKVKVKIYMRSLGAHKESEAFLSQLGLRVEKLQDTVMFDAAASETAQLTDWVCLGTLYSGGTVDLNVVLDVPTELDNQFSSQVGYLDWEFKVEEFEIESTDPTVPKTGDSTNIAIWVALAAVAVAIMILLVLWRRKEDKNKEQKNDGN